MQDNNENPYESGQSGLNNHQKPTHNNDSDPTADTAKTVYILYFVSIIFGIVAIVGLVMAYMRRDDAPDWVYTHFQWQIRTFWIGLLYSVVGVITTPILIGFPILLFGVIWWIIRGVKGFEHLNRQEYIPNPTAWLFK